MRENAIFVDAFNFYIYNGKYNGKQVEEIARKHLKQEDHKGHSGDEYLSGFYKEDKIVPVITLVIFSEQRNGIAHCRYMKCTLQEALDIAEPSAEDRDLIIEEISENS